ncbi:Ceramide_synthetase [Hexamita inflata]|uniref:Ceramide synthetase n=1 Tax=Hexamita inflata TaxID=28002 RepID=A0AA86QAJ4_9EUKA|nr:Ceramide synthetase [Hexamita inflata]
MKNLLLAENAFYLPLFLVPAHMLLRYSYQKLVTHIFRNKKTAHKISESSFYCLQYLVLTIIATTILQTNDVHWFNLESLYVEKLHTSFQPLHAFYMMGELSVYVSAFIFMFFESRKGYGDFIMNVIHHIITISIIAYAFPYKNYNYSVAVAHIHDFSDVFLEFSKTIFYLGYEKASQYTFLAFAVSFIIPRVFVFPTYLITPYWNGKMDATLRKMDPAIDVLATYVPAERKVIPFALSGIYVLNCIWSVAIIKMAIGMFTKKREWGDIREKSEDSQEKPKNE